MLKDDARRYDIRGCWRSDAGVGDAGGGNDGYGSDIGKLQIWKFGSLLSSRKQLHTNKRNYFPTRIVRITFFKATHHFQKLLTIRNFAGR